MRTQAPLLMPLLLLLLLLSPSVSAVASCYDTDQCKDVFQQRHEVCAGHYCGRVMTSDGLVESDVCTACPRATQSDGYVCVPCTRSADLYTILYIIVLFGFFLLYHAEQIDLSVWRRQHRVYLWISLVIEGFLAMICTLMSFRPVMQLNLVTCAVRSINDFYPWAHNPPGQYCANEAVFPILTFPMVFLGFATVFSLLFRPYISSRLCDSDGHHAWYHSLRVNPNLIIIGMFFSGLSWYAWPYVALAYSVIHDVRHLVMFGVRFSFAKGHRRLLFDAAVRYLFSAASYAGLYNWFGLFPHQPLWALLIAFGPMIPIILYYPLRPFTETKDWVFA